MYRYEVAFPIVGIGYYYLDSEEKLLDSDAVKKAYWEITEKADQLDDYNWEVFLKESDAPPFTEAQVIAFAINNSIFKNRASCLIEEWSDD